MADSCAKIRTELARRSGQPSLSSLPPLPPPSAPEAKKAIGPGADKKGKEPPPLVGLVEAAGGGASASGRSKSGRQAGKRGKQGGGAAATASKGVSSPACKCGSVLAHAFEV